MKFLDFFRTPNRRKAKKAAPNRQQRFRTLRVEPLEQRALLTVIPVTPVTYDWGIISRPADEVVGKQFSVKGSMK